jgi:uncharacterized protein
MDKVMRARRMESIHRQVGWIYKDIPWFSEDEARAANEQREGLLRDLSGWIAYSFKGSKLHCGDLSPGCSICGNGGWGCNFINRLCNRNCFYCPQDRSIMAESEPQTDGIFFKSPSEHIFFLKTFQIKGVGFSGGEPLLVLDRLLAHIKEIRREFGDSIYLWVYTNGDLADRDSLEELGQAGLNEIRLDLSARGYDLSPIYLMKKHIPTVTVEIPAIPEDFERVKNLLAKMERMGVDFLNLHQLHASENNYRALCKRNYHFVHDPSISVFESELMALKLLAFAREFRIELPINYCSSVYKRRFQGHDHRTRFASIVMNGWEEITEAAYIRSFRVLDSTDKINKLVGILNANSPRHLWKCNNNMTELSIHNSLLPYVDWSSAAVEITYFEPRIGLNGCENVRLEDSLMVTKKIIYQNRGWSKMAIDCWQRLYVQKIPQKEAFASFMQSCLKLGGNLRDLMTEMQKETTELIKISKFEEIGGGLIEIC